MSKYFKEEQKQEQSLSKYLEQADEKQQGELKYLIEVLGDVSLDVDMMKLFHQQFHCFGGRYSVRTKPETIKGVYSSLIYALLFKDKMKLLPLWISFHLINPVSLWSFIKTKNSFYKDELDNIYGKHNLFMKAFIYCKYNCLNTFAYMTKL